MMHDEPMAPQHEALLVAARAAASADALESRIAGVRTELRQRTGAARSPVARALVVLAGAGPVGQAAVAATLRARRSPAFEPAAPEDLLRRRERLHRDLGRLRWRLEVLRAADRLDRTLTVPRRDGRRLLRLAGAARQPAPVRTLPPGTVAAQLDQAGGAGRIAARQARRAGARVVPAGSLASPPAEPFVLLAGPVAAADDGGWLAGLVATLRADPVLAAVTPVVRDLSGARIDGAWALDWADGGVVARLADAPDPGRAERASLIGSSCLLLRRESLEALLAAAATDEPGLAPGVVLAEQGLTTAQLGTDVHLLEAPAEPPAALGARAPLVRRRVLEGLNAGGNRWCGRPLRVRAPGDLRHVVQAAGWTPEEERPDALLAGGETGWDVTFPGPGGTCSRTAAVVLSPAEGGAAAALSRVLRRASTCVEIGARDWDAAQLGGDLPLAQALCRALGERGHLTSIVVGTDQADDIARGHDVRLHLRGRRRRAPVPGQPAILWIISHPEEVSDDELVGADMVAVASPGDAIRLSRRLGREVRTLLQFTDPAVFFADPVPEPQPTLEVVFVGNWRGSFRPAVRALLDAGVPLALYGEGWPRLAPAHARAAFVSTDEVRRLYASAGAVLNDHWPEMAARGYLSNRLFDALACEARVVSDDAEGLAEVFEDTVPGARNGQELRELVAHALADPKAARARARRGRALVLARHTAAHRAVELSRWFDELLGDAASPK